MNTRSTKNQPLACASGRRHFLVTGSAALASLACGLGVASATQPPGRSSASVTARPRGRGAVRLDSGPLGLESGGRDASVLLPRTIGEGPLPLLVFLHGATQSGASMLRRMGPVTTELGIVLLAPDSRGRTWDAIRDDFGPDIAFLNRALERVFERLPIDTARLAIGGFSDGASYGLSVGLANGDLFRSVIACSPGFVPPAPARGKPRVFVSHGVADPILPIDVCSRVIVPRLQSAGYSVTYREFGGRHEIPGDVAGDALRWMLTPG